jgi:hypothetical protein
VASRVLILLLFIGVQSAKATSPDIPRHYQYRLALYENLADEILNSAEKQDVSLYRNNILTLIQNDLNPVLDEMVVHASDYYPCASTDEKGIQAQYEQLNRNSGKKIENEFFNFYNYQKYVWAKIYIAPTKGWNLLNDWYPKFIQQKFGLNYDTLTCRTTNQLFLNTRVMCYRLKEDLYPEAEQVTRSLFNAYYNHCVYLLKRPSIISYEFFNKTQEVDSLMRIAYTLDLNVDDIKADIANVYIAAAFNDEFPSGISKDEVIDMFYISEGLLKKALEINETGKAHYALGALYNNFLIDYGNMFSAPEKQDLSLDIVPSELMIKSVQHLEDACVMDGSYCNLKRFKDKRRSNSSIKK